MSDRHFLDTNIFVYTFNAANRKKRRIAQDLVAKALSDQAGIISFQVVQEFLNVALGKFAAPLSTPDAKIYLNEVLYPLCEIFPDDELYRSAVETRAATGYSFYDRACTKNKFMLLYEGRRREGRVGIASVFCKYGEKRVV